MATVYNTLRCGLYPFKQQLVTGLLEFLNLVKLQCLLPAVRFMTQVIGVPVTRVCYGAVIPSAPGELTYSEAVYWQNRCRQELEAYNNDPANPDRPLSDEYGPISF